MEFPKTRAQRRYEHFARNTVQLMAELTESQLIELHTIALQMYEERFQAEEKLYADSKARANRSKKA